jgi:hypothetical protein
MNTKSLLTRIGVPVLSLGLLGGLGATLATSASASTAATMASVQRTVTATTYSPNHYDTTSVQTGLNVANGPLWAYDNLHETFTAVPGTTAGQWSVTISVKGTFDGFASPTVANTPEVNRGIVNGTISYDVTSPNKPSQAQLPRVEPSYTGLGAALSQFFGGSETVTGGGSYLFTYSDVDGVVYTQSG